MCVVQTLSKQPSMASLICQPVEGPWGAGLGKAPLEGLSPEGVTSVPSAALSSPPIAPRMPTAVNKKTSFRLDGWLFVIGFTATKRRTLKSTSYLYKAKDATMQAVQTFQAYGIALGVQSCFEQCTRAIAASFAHASELQTCR